MCSIKDPTQELFITDIVSNINLKHIDSPETAREIIQAKYPDISRENKEKLSIELWILGRVANGKDNDPLIVALEAIK